MTIKELELKMEIRANELEELLGKEIHRLSNTIQTLSLEVELLKEMVKWLTDNK
jgi:hypothetical protein